MKYRTTFCFTFILRAWGVALLMLLSYFDGQSQCNNLIGNGSFERFYITSYRPDSFQYSGLGTLQDSTLVDMYSPMEYRATTDIFNRSVSYLYPNGCRSWLCVPDNFAGNRETHSGNAYTGIINYALDVYRDTAYTYREYIGIKLRQQLLQGQCYKFRYYAALAQTSREMCFSLGAVVTDTAFLFTDFSNPRRVLLIANPQIQAPISVYDSLGWFAVEGEYIAQGGEQFITIGNFLPDSVAPIVFMSRNRWNESFYDYNKSVSYFYIDDVSLIACEADTVQKHEYTLCDGDSLVLQLDTFARGSCSWHNEDGNLVHRGFRFTFYPDRDTILDSYITHDTSSCYVRRDLFRFRVAPQLGSGQKYLLTGCVGDKMVLKVPDFPHTRYRFYTSFGDTLSTLSSYSFEPYENAIIYAYMTDTLLGCSKRVDTFFIELDFPPCMGSRYTHPSAFTPNGDGQNETFYPLCSKPCKVELLRIYNSWGEIVHEGDTPWDGTYRGSPQPTGAYWYRSMIDSFPFHGVVTLLR